MAKMPVFKRLSGEPDLLQPKLVHYDRPRVKVYAKCYGAKDGWRNVFVPLVMGLDVAEDRKTAHSEGHFSRL